MNVKKILFVKFLKYYLAIAKDNDEKITVQNTTTCNCAFCTTTKEGIIKKIFRRILCDGAYRNRRKI